MKVDVLSQPTGSFSIGAGFSSIENFMFTAQVQKNNFLGLGYIMAASANISGMRQQANFNIFDPYFLDSRWTLRIGAYLTQQQYLENEVSRGGNLGIGRYLDAKDDQKLERSTRSTSPRSSSGAVQGSDCSAVSPTAGVSSRAASSTYGQAEQPHQCDQGLHGLTQRHPDRWLARE